MRGGGGADCITGWRRMAAHHLRFSEAFGSHADTLRDSVRAWPVAGRDAGTTGRKEQPAR